MEEQNIKLTFTDNKHLYLSLDKLKKFSHLTNIQNELKTANFVEQTDETVLYIPSTKADFIVILDIIERREFAYDMSYIKLLDFLGVNITNLIPKRCELNEENYKFLLNYNKDAAYNMFKYNAIHNLYEGELNYIIDNHVLELCYEFESARRKFPAFLRRIIDNSPSLMNKTRGDHVNRIYHNEFLKKNFFLDRNTLKPYENTNVVSGLDAGINLTPNNHNNICLNNPGKYYDQDTTRLGNKKTKITHIYGINPLTKPGQQIFIDEDYKVGIVSENIEYKKDIMDITTVLDTKTIHDLNPICFKYINDENETKQYGLNINEVNKLIPEIVHNEAINYNAIIMMLIKEVQSLRKEVDELKKA